MITRSGTDILEQAGFHLLTKMLVCCRTGVGQVILSESCEHTFNILLLLISHKVLGLGSGHFLQREYNIPKP
jgi:hypothetical protein